MEDFCQFQPSDRRCKGVPREGCWQRATINAPAGCTSMLKVSCRWTQWKTNRSFLARVFLHRLLFVGLSLRTPTLPILNPRLWSHCCTTEQQALLVPSPYLKKLNPSVKRKRLEYSSIFAYVWFIASGNISPGHFAKVLKAACPDLATPGFVSCQLYWINRSLDLQHQPMQTR